MPPQEIYTNTYATITSANSGQITNTLGYVVGDLHNLQIDWFDDTISGTVTITLPYKDEDIPVEYDETQLRAVYFNGLSWIKVPGIILFFNEPNCCVQQTPFLVGKIKFQCNEPFGLSLTEEYNYDQARDYFRSSLVDHQDLFVVDNSEGHYLLELDARKADWPQPPKPL